MDAPGSSEVLGVSGLQSLGQGRSGDRVSMKAFTTVRCVDTGEICYSYSEYLRSRHWADLKRKYWKSRLPKVCIVCGRSDGYFDFHHKTYKRIGREWLMDVGLAHRGCHLDTHDVIRSSNSSRINLWNAHRKLRRNRLEEKS